MRKKRQLHQIMSSSSHSQISMEQPKTPQRMRSLASSLHLQDPPSPCATSTSTTSGSFSSPGTTRSSMSIGYSLSTSGSNNNKITIRYLPTTTTSTGGNGNNNNNRKHYLPPSPSRSVLDPHYASRLYKGGKNGHGHDVPNSDLQLKPPPGILRAETPRSSAVFSTPVASVASDAPEEAGTGTGNGAPGSVMSSSASTQYFTPERPRRATTSSTLNTNTTSSNSAQVPQTQTPSRGFYTPQSSPAHKQRGSTFYSSYSPNATCTPSRNNGRVKQEGEYNHNQNHLYSDRFIPSRATSNLTFSVWDDSRNNNNIIANEEGNSNSPGNDATNDVDGGSPRQDGTSPNNQQQSQQQPLLNALLRSELLGENLEPSLPPSTMGMSPNANNNRNDRSGRQALATVRTPLREGVNYLKFGQSPRQNYHDDVFRRSHGGNPTSVVDSFNLSPVGVKSSHRLMNMPQKRKRKIAKVPFKVLDAPSLADDFYLNLVDWSSLNVLAVGLGSCVYLWSACTSKVTKLCDLGASSQDSVTSVSWTQRGTHLAVGVNTGEVQLWDTVKCKKIRAMSGHSARIGALSWSGATLASGSRDRNIFLRDVRVQQPFTARLAAHKQEVCGLKWSFDEPAHLASGGNDNKLLVWDIKNHRQPKHRFAEHTAAVKAIAWSPHQHGLLASGGGTADRCIRFWNALSGTSLNAIDTGSQVCNLSWSKNCNEIVSTHGYSLNQIAIWKYPTMQKVATLTGHTYRVLYLAMSPDGSTIVT